MTVGPMIVRTRDAPLGSPTHAWIKPAPIEATPAATATHQSLRERLFGHTWPPSPPGCQRWSSRWDRPTNHQPAACGRAEMPTLLWVLAAGVAMSLLAYNLASASTVLVGALDADALEPVRGAIQPGVTGVGILAR
jgi:hypothetical protein